MKKLLILSLFSAALVGCQPSGFFNYGNPSLGQNLPPATFTSPSNNLNAHRNNNQFSQSASSVSGPYEQHKRRQQDAVLEEAKRLKKQALENEASYGDSATNRIDRLFEHEPDISGELDKAFDENPDIF